MAHCKNEIEEHETDSKKFNFYHLYIFLSMADKNLCFNALLHFNKLPPFFNPCSSLVFYLCIFLFDREFK